MGFFDVATASVTTILRGGLGLRTGAVGARPKERLVLYEFEGCPFCRKAREALSILDLEAEIRPCPKRGTRYRDELVERGGKAQFPYLIDPNTGREMYESGDIVDYLYAEYGRGDAPVMLGGSAPATVAVALSGLGRGSAGSFVRPSQPPAKPLELYSFEASPFCRLVRERLCELELRYVLHNVARGSARRDAFVERSGKMQVPYLADPNTGIEMFESADILAYLDDTYGA
ncbi:MAG: glutathione S-transferase N-terminal domain-containing protein [Myxococcota bacterium]